MPAISGSITIRRYRITGPLPSDPSGYFSKHLRAHRFYPVDVDGEEEISVGWVSCTDQDDADLAPGRIMFGDRLVVSMRVDTLKPSAKDVKRVMQNKLREMTLENLGKIGRREKKNLKAQVIRELRRRAVPKTKTVDMAWDLGVHAQLGRLGRLYFFSTGKSDNERFEELFDKTFGPLGLGLEHEGPSRWAADELPRDFEMEPQRELIFGFPGTRPGVLVEMPASGDDEDDDGLDTPF